MDHSKTEQKNNTYINIYIFFEKDLVYPVYVSDK